MLHQNIQNSNYLKVFFILSVNLLKNPQLILDGPPDCPVHKRPKVSSLGEQLKPGHEFKLVLNAIFQQGY